MLSHLVLRHALRNWVALKSLKHTSFEENNAPLTHASDDYRVEYKAKFRAPDNKRAQVDIVITSEGYIGVGLETRARVAQRLAVKNLRDGYAAGFEPCEQNVQKFMVFLGSGVSGPTRD